MSDQNDSPDQYDAEASTDETPEVTSQDVTPGDDAVTDESVPSGVQTVDASLTTEALTDAETPAPTDDEVADGEAEDEAVDETPDENDPLEAFRRELWAKPGDWFVIHTYSGMEKRVKQNLENRIISLNMEDYIHEIVVPTEEVAEIKNGQRKMVTRTVLPGYVLVRMDLTDESWSAVRHTPSVTGFVGHSHQPVPLSMTRGRGHARPGRGRGRRGRGCCRRR